MQIYIVSKDYAKQCEVPKTFIHMTQNTESEQGNYHSAGLVLLPFFVPVFQGFL